VRAGQLTVVRYGHTSALPHRFIVLIAALAAFALVACGGDTKAPATPSATVDPATSTATPTRPPLTGKITVFATSSLTDVYKTIGKSFQEKNPGVTVEFNFASSSALETQIEQAAPADVFASADLANMQKARDKSLIEGAPVNFARNVPVIVVPAANKAAIAVPKDLAKAGVKLVLAGPDVPIGNYARQVIDKLAADPAIGAAFKDATLKNLVSNEANVRAVLTKVELGEADAGIVYKTDALVSGPKVTTVAIPDAANVIAVYPIAVVKGSKNAVVAAEFVAYVKGADGQAALKAAGFDPAP